jgi:hypothetical protein
MSGSDEEDSNIESSDEESGGEEEEESEAESSTSEPGSGDSDAVEADGDDGDAGDDGDDGDNAEADAEAETAQPSPQPVVESLQAENAALRAEVQRLRMLYEPGAPAAAPSASPSTAPAALATLMNRPATRSPRSYKMQAVLPPNIETISSDVSFKKSTFGFPHKAKPNKSGAADLFLENRINVSLAFELRDVLSNRCLSESCLPVRPKFRLDIVHANDESLVRDSDFKTMPKNLIEAGRNIESMSAGKVVFSFKIGFLSSQSSRDGYYRFKLTCVSPELSMYPLEACTPAWRAVSRDIKKRGREVVESE